MLSPMNVSLTRELEQFVNQKVKSGRYQTASEVVREALRALEERDQFTAHRLGTSARKSPRHVESLLFALRRPRFLSPRQGRSLGRYG